jgi:hypothetical protein
MKRKEIQKKFDHFVDEALAEASDSVVVALEQDMYDEKDDYEIKINLKNFKESLIGAFNEICKEKEASADNLLYENVTRQAIRAFQRNIVAGYLLDAKNRHTVQEFCDNLFAQLLRTEGAWSEIEHAQLEAELQGRLYGNEVDQKTMTDLLNRVRAELSPERAERVLGINPEDLEHNVDLAWLKEIMTREFLRLNPKNHDSSIKTAEERISEAVSEASEAFMISLRDGSTFETDELVSELFEPFWISKLETMKERLVSEPKEGTVHEFKPKKR